MDAEYIIYLALQQGLIDKKPSKKRQQHLQQLIDELDTDDEEFILNYIDLSRI